MEPMYRLWLVCDSTQRFTLELGGYDSFWWEIYENATAQHDHTCEAVLFEAHRAAFYKSPQMPYDYNRAVWVNDRFSAFLEQIRHFSSAAFYNVNDAFYGIVVREHQPWEQSHGCIFLAKI